MKKKNVWFDETFLKSFGFCHPKSISDKQADIFFRYLDFDDRGNNNYHCYYDGKDITMYLCYIHARIPQWKIVICRDTRKEVEHYEKLAEDLDKQLDYLDTLPWSEDVKLEYDRITKQQVEYYNISGQYYSHLLKECWE